MTDTDPADLDSRLLREIAADPESDAPRLEYATLLRERGDPLGEFIHVQCAIARRPRWVTMDHLDTPVSPGVPGKGWARNSELEDWNQKLLDEHGEGWAAPLKQAGAKTVRYHRGFPRGLGINADVFPSVVAPLLSMAPTVRELLIERSNFDDNDGEIFPAAPCPPELARRIAAAPELARLTALRLAGPECWGDEALRQVITSPHLGKLQLLDLSCADPSPEIVEEALAPLRFPHLHSLILSLNPTVGAEHARRIERAPPSPRRLRLLDLRETNVGDEGAACLARAPCLDGLEELHIDRSGVTELGIYRLLDSEYLKNTLIVFSPKSLPEAARHRVEERLRRHNDRHFLLTASR